MSAIPMAIAFWRAELRLASTDAAKRIVMDVKIASKRNDIPLSEEEVNAINHVWIYLIHESHEAAEQLQLIKGLT